MSENLENQLLVYIRELVAGQERIEHKLNELSVGLNNLESDVLKLRAESLGTPKDIYPQLS